MTDAPERIAMRWKTGAAVTSGPLMDNPDYTQYIRADLVAAMIEAEREACAQAVEDEALECPSDSDDDLAYDAAIIDAAAAIRKRGGE